MYKNYINFPKTFFVFLLVIYSYNTYSQQFEGTISFEKITLSDTTYFTYYVKDNMIRIDGYDKNRELINSLLIDTDKNIKIALDMDMRRYSQRPVAMPQAKNKIDFQFEKLPNTKIVYGKECKQWIVTNEKENSVVTYWVIGTKYTFFANMLKVLGATDKISTFFMQIDGAEGYIPLLAEARSMLRETQIRITVTEIKEQPLNISLFQIPPDFSRYN